MTSIEVAAVVSEGETQRKGGPSAMEGMQQKPTDDRPDKLTDTSEQPTLPRLRPIHLEATTDGNGARPHEHAGDEAVTYPRLLALPDWMTHKQLQNGDNSMSEWDPYQTNSQSQNGRTNTTALATSQTKVKQQTQKAIDLNVGMGSGPVPPELSGRRRPRVGDLLLILDCIMTLLALGLAALARDHLPLGVHLSLRETLLSPGLALVVLLVWVTVFHAFSIYDPKYQGNPFDLSRLLLATISAGVVLGGVLYLTVREVPRLFFIYFWFTDAALLSIERVIVRYFAVKSDWYKRRVLIVGTGPVAGEVARMITKYRSIGLDLVGFVSDDESQPGSAREIYGREIAILGTLENLEQIIRQQLIDDVIFTMPWREHARAHTLMTTLQRLPVQVRVVPDYFELATRARVEDFSGMPLVSLNDAVIGGGVARLKRLIDIVVSALALLVLWPVMLIIAIAIRLDSPGPAIFKQRRVGQYHRLFTMYKFRTMVVDAEQRAAEVLQQKDGTVIHKSPTDPRVTRVGAFLRRTSLDELPQLFNVLKGDMSLVGPRPELPWLVTNYEPWQYRRLKVPQGITGWWQVNGRGDRLMHLHTEDDLFYIRNYSIWLDLKIILQTIRAVFSRRGAF
jgi:exopolysaccharide biosynthesis polyprenyl glycosylphosphotransferase